MIVLLVIVWGLSSSPHLASSRPQLKVFRLETESKLDTSRTTNSSSWPLHADEEKELTLAEIYNVKDEKSHWLNESVPVVVLVLFILMLLLISYFWVRGIPGSDPPSKRDLYRTLDESIVPSFKRSLCYIEAANEEPTAPKKRTPIGRNKTVRFSNTAVGDPSAAAFGSWRCNREYWSSWPERPPRSLPTHSHLKNTIRQTRILPTMAIPIEAKPRWERGVLILKEVVGSDPKKLCLSRKQFVTRAEEPALAGPPDPTSWAERCHRTREKPPRTNRFRFSQHEVHSVSSDLDASPDDSECAAIGPVPLQFVDERFIDKSPQRPSPAAAKASTGTASEPPVHRVQSLCRFSEYDGSLQSSKKRGFSPSQDNPGNVIPSAPSEYHRDAFLRVMQAPLETKTASSGINLPLPRIIAGEFSESAKPISKITRNTRASPLVTKRRTRRALYPKTLKTGHFKTKADAAGCRTTDGTPRTRNVPRATPSALGASMPLRELLAHIRGRAPRVMASCSSARFTQSELSLRRDVLRSCLSQRISITPLKVKRLISETRKWQDVVLNDPVSSTSLSKELSPLPFEVAQAKSREAFGRSRIQTVRSSSNQHIAGKSQSATEGCQPPSGPSDPSEGSVCRSKRDDFDPAAQKLEFYRLGETQYSTEQPKISVPAAAEMLNFVISPEVRRVPPTLVVMTRPRAQGDNNTNLRLSTTAPIYDDHFTQSREILSSGNTGSSILIKPQRKSDFRASTRYTVSAATCGKYLKPMDELSPVHRSVMLRRSLTRPQCRSISASRSTPEANVCEHYVRASPGRTTSIPGSDVTTPTRSYVTAPIDELKFAMNVSRLDPDLVAEVRIAEE